MKERKTYLDIIRSSSVLIIVLFHFSCLLEDFNYKGYNNFFLHMQMENGEEWESFCSL